jgi:hypothetical protein
MNSWNTASRRRLVDGAIASALSSAALATRGTAEGAGPCAPNNAISHWIREDEAYEHHEPDLRHTLTGYLIDHGCARSGPCCSSAPVEALAWCWTPCRAAAIQLDR